MPPTTGSSSSAPVDQVLAQNAPSPAKRKRASKEADATPAAGNGASAQKRPVKRRKGKLARLPEMPLEVLFEIFGHLHPYDLLRLSRASKALRALVLHKRMKNVWTNALAALNMPPCPLDISEPRYTALAFENICSFCRGAGAKHLVWVWRLRTCPTCWADAKPAYLGDTHTSKFVAGRFILGDLEDVELYGLLHSVRSGKSNSRRSQTIYLRSEVDEVRSIWNALGNDHTAHTAFIRERQTWLQAAQQHSLAYEDWVRNQKSNREEALELIRTRRKEQIIAHLRDLGWGPEMDYILANSVLENAYAFFSHKDVRVAKALTPAGWDKIRDTLVYHCEQIRAERIAYQRNVVQVQRLALLQRLLTERTMGCLEEANPNLADVCGMSAFADIINLSIPDIDQGEEEDIVTEASFEEAFEAFPALAEDWRMRRRSELGTLVKDAISHMDRPAYLQPPAAHANFVDLTGDEDEAALPELDATEPASNLALAIFRCCASQTTHGWHTAVGLPYASGHSSHWYGTEEALFHTCWNNPATFGDPGIMFGITTPTLEELIRARFNIRHWNADNKISVSPWDLTAAMMVLRVCEKPSNATALEVDRLDARFRCKQCTVNKVATVYNWREAIAHIIDYHPTSCGSIGHMHPILVQQFGAIAAEILRLSQPCGIVRLSQACERRAKEAEADQRVRGILPDGNNWGCARPGCTQVKNKSPKDMYAHLEQMHGVRDPRRRDIRYTSRREWIVPFPSIQLNFF